MTELDGIEDGLWRKRTSHGWSVTGHKVTNSVDSAGRVFGSIICDSRYMVEVIQAESVPIKTCRECKRVIAKLVADKLKGAKKPDDYVESFEWSAGLAGGPGWTKDTYTELLKALKGKK